MRIHRSILGTAGVALSLLTAPAATARIFTNTIDATAVITETPRQVIVTGPITCTAGERAYLSVTLSQRTTGAVASGQAVVTCTGSEQHWDIAAAVQGRQSFDRGPAIAVAIATTVTQGVTTDAHQWLVPVALVEE